jgi:hypothetical protein
MANLGRSTTSVGGGLLFQPERKKIFTFWALCMLWVSEGAKMLKNLRYSTRNIQSVLISRVTLLKLNLIYFAEESSR